MVASSHPCISSTQQTIEIDVPRMSMLQLTNVNIKRFDFHVIILTGRNETRQNESHICKWLNGIVFIIPAELCYSGKI